MRIKEFTTTIFTAFLFCFMIMVTDVSAEENISANPEILEPTITFYDESDNVIEPYTEEELNQINEEAKNILEGVKILEDSISHSLLNTGSTYRFGATSFTNNIWVNGGNSFKDIGSVVVDAKYKVYSLKVKVVGPSGTGGSIVMDNFTGGMAFPFYHLPRGNYYTVQLINMKSSSQTIYLNGGYVIFNKSSI